MPSSPAHASYEHDGEDKCGEYDGEFHSLIVGRGDGFFSVLGVTLSVMFITKPLHRQRVLIAAMMMSVDIGLTAHFARPLH